MGRRLVYKLALRDVRTAWDFAQKDHKSIKRRGSTTLELTVLELQGIAEKLRSRDSLTRAFYVFLKTNPHCPDLLKYSPSAVIELERSAKLMAAMDELNQKMGRGTVTLGRPSPGAAWHLRCANRTPRWTTRWGELVNVKAR